VGREVGPELAHRALHSQPSKKGNGNSNGGQEVGPGTHIERNVHLTSAAGRQW
jgi:hypothetical protein